jgi:DNA-binding Xre family transcriptional regulator
MAVATAKRRKPHQTFLLDKAKRRVSRFALLHPHLVSSKSDIREWLPRATRDSLWISYAGDLTEALVKNASAAQPALGLGLFIHSLDVNAIPALASCFRRIAFTTDGGFLPAEELAEVLKAANRHDLFIGGSVDQATGTITFWRGDLKPLAVPFSAFEMPASRNAPDLSRFSVIDCGQTVRLGGYEAAVDTILYEYDSDYRRRLSKKRLEQEQSFGASLRRLRKQRGLRREDFEPAVSAKTIARIEQNKVQRVQKKTLNALAERLAVPPQDIGSF